MNILHIADSISDSDGVSSHILQLMKSIDRRKAKQFLLCGKINSDMKFKASSIDAIQLHDFYHAERSITGFGSAVKRLMKISGDSGIDVIHSHSHYAANIAWYVSRLTGIRTVQTVHGIIPDSGKLGHFKAHKFICVSEPGFKHLRDVQHVPAGRIFLIRQGIEHKGIPSERKFQKEKLHIVFASRFEHEKGPDVFIRAAGIVNSKCTDIRFSMAGIGSMTDELSKLNSDLNAKVDFCGVVNDIFAFLKTADVFVMSGRTKHEGFPMAIAEAGVAGCLIITSRFDALEYVFKENKDGMVFEIDDHEELAEGILYAANNREDSLKMSESFRNKSRKVFDPETFAIEHLRVYNE